MKLAAIAATAVVLMSATSSFAQDRCRVMDPTGTPLNVRTQPQGRVIGTLPNGHLVSILETSRDRNNRPWAYVRDYSNGDEYGWVFREFIACF